MPTIRSVCVFCGSSPSNRPEFGAAADAVGAALAAAGLRVVYGGAKVGLMGRVADAALAGGAEVIGVLPEALVTKEVAHDRLAELRIVASMHERKAQMNELADAFLTLPGGLGTLEELFEIVSWGQLGLHHKPCGLLNVARFYDPLIAFLDQAVECRLLKPIHRQLVLDDDSVPRLLTRLQTIDLPATGKWLDRNET